MPEVITADNGHIVGWAYTPLGGKKQIQLHWLYDLNDLDLSI